MIGLIMPLVLAAGPGQRPHILFFMADDLGHGNVGWHRRQDDGAVPPEVQTPTMDLLVAEGIDLRRVYSYKFCSPTRSSFISGRLPYHVNMENTDPASWDPTTGEGAGVATGMTGIGAVLARGGYSTAAVGKWDAGMATVHHTPAGRGFQQSLIYFHHCNDYWTSTVSNATDKFCSQDSATIDLWRDPGPGPGPGGGPAAPRPGGAAADVYEEEIFVAEAQRIIKGYAGNRTATAAGPLFLYYASHAPHTPMQMPQFQLDKMLHVKDLSLTGQGYAAMVAVADQALGNLTATLREQGLWDRTLLIFMSDNGGPIYDDNWRGTGGCPDRDRPGMTGPLGREPYRSTCLDFGGAASNHPLKGGKESFWEGGVRVAAFAAGGFIPAAERGSSRDALIATADWLASFAALAGVDPTDTKAAAHGLPPIDSIDQSAVLLSGAGSAPSPPRTQLVLDPSAIIVESGPHLYKLLLGRVSFATWTGPRFPNASSDNASMAVGCDCGSAGCLYDVAADPTEHVEIGAANPGVVARLRDMLLAAATTTFAPSRGVPIQAACDTARTVYHGHYGPFIQVDP